MATKRLAPDERRAAILRVAGELFSRQPYAAVSIGDIAAAAGVSPPLIVFYYGSKRTLYLAVIRTAVSTISTGLANLPGGTWPERLRAGVAFYAGYALSHRAGFLSLLRGGIENSLPEAAELVESLRLQIAQTIVADVTAALPSVDPPGRAVLEVGVRGYLGFVDAAIVPWLDLPDSVRAEAGPETIASLAVAAFTGMLSAAAGGRSAESG